MALSYEQTMRMLKITVILYIYFGVKASIWMDDNYFDPERTRAQADDFRDFLRCGFWIVYLPIVAFLVKKGKKYRL